MTWRREAAKNLYVLSPFVLYTGWSGWRGAKAFCFQHPRAPPSLTKPIQLEIKKVFATCCILHPEWDVGPIHRSVTPSPPIPTICRQYLFIHLGEKRQCKELRQLQYYSWYFKTVSYFTRLTAREITYNNFEISLVVFMPYITTNHAITFTKNLLQCFSKLIVAALSTLN